MSVTVRVPVSVLLQRHTLDHDWSGQRWKTSSVAISRHPGTTRGLPGLDTAQPIIERSGDLLLMRSEVPAYLINLVNGAPALFVAIEETDTSVSLTGITASPLALDAFDRPGVVAVDRVPMPREIIDTIRAFVDSLRPITGARPPRFSPAV